MAKFDIYAHGIYWGTWAAESAAHAIRMAAEDVGTDGDTTGIVAIEKETK